MIVGMNVIVRFLSWTLMVPNLCTWQTVRRNSRNKVNNHYSTELAVSIQQYQYSLLQQTAFSVDMF